MKFRGDEIVVAYDPVELAEVETTREWALYLPVNSWDWVWGETISCPSPVIIAQLKKLKGLDEDSQVCLAWSEQDEWELTSGPPNFWGKCGKSYCEYYREGSAWVAGGVLATKSYVQGTRLYTWIASYDVVEHVSGSPILRRFGRYLPGTLASYRTWAVVIATRTNVVLNVVSVVDLVRTGIDAHCTE
jgi:hypothetical protein